LKAISEKHGSGVDSLPAAVSTAALLPAEANGVTGDSRFEPFSESFVSKNANKRSTHPTQDSTNHLRLGFTT
jgi:hypothetical protein